MNSNLLFVISCLIVFCILVGMNFESMYNYAVWHIPLHQINNMEIYYDDSHITKFGHNFAPHATNIKYIDANTINVTFRNYTHHAHKAPEFEFTSIMHIGDKVITYCHPLRNTDQFNVWIFSLTKMNKTHLVVNHYGSDLPDTIPCKYPEIIKYSLGIKWKDLPPIPDSSPFHNYTILT